VLKKYPSDRKAFVQGLTFLENDLLMSTGLWGRSSLRLINFTSGEVKRNVNNPPVIFSEGVAILGDKIFQITYQDRTCFVYETSDLSQVHLACSDCLIT
jgi:glutamine cyclotransferase